MLWLTAFLMEAEVLNLVMDIRVLRVKEHPWRITMRQVFLKLMVKWLPSLVFLMVFALAFHFLNFINLRVFFFGAFVLNLMGTVLFRSWRR